MKKALLILSSAFVLVAISCTKELASGSLKFYVDSDVDVAIATKSKISDITTLPDGKDFSLVIKNSADKLVWSDSLKNWSETTKLPEGTYKVTASYGTANDEGVSKPQFVGEREFSIMGDKTTEVKIPVELKNCIIKVSCTDVFKNYFTDYTFTLTTSANHEFEIDKDWTDPIFINADKVTVKGKLTNQGGAVQNFEKTYDNLKAATCYTLMFDASSIGGFKVTVTFNDDVTTVDLGDLEIN